MAMAMDKPKVFVLDRLELSVLNKPEGVTPRISLYDYESMKKMVEQITVNIAGGEVTFSGGKACPTGSVLLQGHARAVIRNCARFGHWNKN
uniref:Uncharacterized protein n=1 Tax=Aegilops tauschii TaxID=37682 RepID=M8C5Y9_AEGTA